MPSSSASTARRRRAAARLGSRTGRPARTCRARSASTRCRRRQLQLLEYRRELRALDGDGAAHGRVVEQRGSRELPRRADAGDLRDEPFDGERFGVCGRTRCASAVASSSRDGRAVAGVDVTPRLEIGRRHCAVRRGRDDGARRQRRFEPRHLVGEIAARPRTRRARRCRCRPSSATGRSRCSAARSCSRANRRCRRGCARLRSRGRRRWRRRLRGARRRRLARLAASSRSCQLPRKLGVAREIQREALELDGADLDAPRQQRQQLDARGDAARRRERLRGAAEVRRAADRDAAGFDGEPREVGEPQIFVDRQRAARARRERVGRDALVVVRDRTSTATIATATTSEHDERRDGAEHESSTMRTAPPTAGRRAGSRCRETT